MICLMLMCGTAYAGDKFPEKPVTVLIPWDAGGGMDLNARALQPRAEKVLGQPLVIVNRPGGAGTVAFLEAARSPATGYVVCGVTPSLLITQYTTLVGVDYRKYKPVIVTAYSPSGITVNANAPWNTLEEFLAYARGNPGKVRVSNSGPGGLWHIIAVAIEQAAGVKFQHVPYQGGAPAATAVAGGHVEATTTGISECWALIKAGKLKCLGVTAPVRFALAPDIPTFKEQGYDISLGVWWGYVVPRETPDQVVKTLHDAFKEAMEGPEFQKYADMGAVMVYYKGPEEFQALLDEEDKLWKRLIETAGVGVK